MTKFSLFFIRRIYIMAFSQRQTIKKESCTFTDIHNNDIRTHLRSASLKVNAFLFSSHHANVIYAHTPNN